MFVYLLLLGTVIYIVVIAVLQRREERLFLSSWRDYAEGCDGQLRPEFQRGRFFWRHLPIFELSVDDVLVRVEGISSWDPKRPSSTHIRARYLLPGTGPQVRISRAPHMRAITSLEGLARVRFPTHGAFDKRFAYFCADRELAERVIDSDAMRHMLDLERLNLLWSGADEVYLSMTGLFADPTAMSAAVHLVGALASRDLAGLTHLRKQAGAVYIPPRGPWEQRSGPRVEFRSALATVAVQPIVVGKRAVTEVSLNEERPRELLSISLDAQGNIAHVTGDQDSLSSAAVAALKVVGAGTFQVTSERIRFTWTELEADRARIEAAVALVRSYVAAPMPGAYRGAG